MASRGRSALNLQAFGLLIVALLLGAVGQLLLKQSLDAFTAKHGELQGLAMLFQALMTVGVMAGLGCYVLSTLLYLQLLAKLPVSLLYPMVALNYVFVTVLAWAFLKEHVPPLRLVGLAVIIAGVYIVANTMPKEGAETPVGEDARGALHP